MNTPAVDRILELRRRRLGEPRKTLAFVAPADAVGGYAAVRRRILAATRADMAEADRMMTSVDATWADMAGASAVASAGCADMQVACAFEERAAATGCRSCADDNRLSIDAARHTGGAMYVSLSAAPGTAARVRATWDAMEAERRACRRVPCLS